MRHINVSYDIDIGYIMYRFFCVRRSCVRGSCVCVYNGIIQIRDLVSVDLVSVGVGCLSLCLKTQGSYVEETHCFYLVFRQNFILGLVYRAGGLLDVSGK